MKTLGQSIRFRTYFTFIILAELATATLITFAMSWAIYGPVMFIPHMSFYLAEIIVGCVISITITSTLGRIYFSPLSRVCDAMKKVAGGNFNVQLKDTTNVRELSRFYEDFNTMTAELRTTEIIQSDFVSNVSHEFKTPIATIEGYVTLLQDPELNEEKRKEILSKLLLSTNRLSSLVEDVLLISKLENQSVQPPKSPFRVDEQIRQVIVMYENKWEAKNLELDVEIEDMVINSCAALLRHVWSNLIGNAIKFDPEGGQLIVRLKSDKNNLVFSVEDSGPGLPEDKIDHVFDKFFQADTKHKGDGNGLGLALVKNIVQLLGGEVSCRNRSGGGAGFDVFLPLDNKTAQI